MQPIKRDLRIDAVRGVMLLMLLFGHFGGVVRDFTHQKPGFVTAAEGFIFLSGLVTGIVYSRFAHEFGNRAMFRKSWKRAAEIWAWHAGTWIVILAGVHIFGVVDSFPPWVVPPLDLTGLKRLVLFAVLWERPPWMGILPLYIVLMAMAPCVVYAVTRGAHRWMLTISFFLWVGAQLWWTHDFGAAHLPWQPWIFNLLAWQFLFNTGVYLGYLRITGTPIITNRNWLVALAGAVALFMFAWRWDLLTSLGLDDTQAMLRAKADLPWFRLLNFFALAGVVSWLGERFPVAMGPAPLALLGQFSLQVFSFHILLMYWVRTFMPQIQQASPFGEAVTSLTIEWACAASLLGVAWSYRHWRRYRADRLAYGA